MKLIYSDIIEQAMERALKSSSPVHELHFLKALIETPGSISYTQLKHVQGKVEELIKNKQFGESSLKTWIKEAQGEAIQKNRSVVMEKDFLKYFKNHFEVTVKEQKQADQKEGKLESDTIPEGVENVLNKMSTAVVENPVYLQQAVEFLNRHDKNNLVIYGEKGVGKTSLVYAIAKKIQSGNVPSFMKGKKIYSLNSSALVLNVHNPREISVKISSILEFIKSNSEERILFIPEFELFKKNTLLYDNLRHYISNFSINVIVEMNFDNYADFKKDIQLHSQFNKIEHKEPSVEESIEILEAVAEGDEHKKGVFIPKDVLKAIVEISAKHISGQFLPEKAIDVLDQSCSALVLKAEMPTAQEALIEKQIKSLNISSKYGKDLDQKELLALQDQLAEKKKHRDQVSKLIKENSVLINELSELESLDKNSENQEKLKEISQKIATNKEFTTLSKMDICEVVSIITEVPKEKIAESKQENILELANNLEKRVFGQTQAVKSVSETLMSSYAGLSADNKPMGSFLLLGPSGVGKTEIAKALTELLFDHERYMIRLDLSEYSEKHSVSKLIGAPSGYAGYEEGGVLTEAVRNKPYSVVLFDEVEKAHKDFADILLQILDDGRLTDNKGRTVSFKNTIIFLTSNVKDPTTYFKPEVLGRFNNVIKFNSLDKAVIPKVIQKELKNVNKKLKEKGLELSLTDEMVTYMSDKGYSADYGARPVINLFSQMITQKLAKEILGGRLQKGKVVVGIKDGQSTFGQV